MTNDTSIDIPVFQARIKEVQDSAYKNFHWFISFVDELHPGKNARIKMISNIIDTHDRVDKSLIMPATRVLIAMLDIIRLKLRDDGRPTFRYRRYFKKRHHDLVLQTILNFVKGLSEFTFLIYRYEEFVMENIAIFKQIH